MFTHGAGRPVFALKNRAETSGAPAMPTMNVARLRNGAIPTRSMRRFTASGFAINEDVQSQRLLLRTACAPSRRWCPAVACPRMGGLPFCWHAPRVLANESRRRRAISLPGGSPGEPPLERHWQSLKKPWSISNMCPTRTHFHLTGINRELPQNARQQRLPGVSIFRASSRFPS